MSDLGYLNSSLFSGVFKATMSESVKMRIFETVDSFAE